MENEVCVEKPIKVLAALLFCTANITMLKAGPVSFSFFLGVLLIFFVFTRFPYYARVNKDMWPWLLLVGLSIFGLLLSPVSLDGTSLFTLIQLVYWFLIANIFSNISLVLSEKLFIKAILFAMAVIGLVFCFFPGEDGPLSENESSFIVVVAWPLGLFYFYKWKRYVYVLLVAFLLFLIGSRTGIILLLIQLIGFFLIKKLESKNMIRLLVFFLIGYLLISNSNVRLFVAEKVFPEDEEMQMVIETPELVLQMDKSWVQRRIQQEKCKQVAGEYPILGIGPLNLVRYNIDIDVSKLDVDNSILDIEYHRSFQRSSHNAYFQLMAENGIIGITLVLFVFIKLLYHYYKIREDDENHIIMMLSMIGMFINLFMLSGFWGTNTWLMLGLYIGYIRNRMIMYEDSDSFE